MPPKQSVSCRGRDATLLSQYISNPTLKRKLFATALENSQILSKFNGQIEASECLFSYPDSEWYGVYLLDEAGERFWDSASGKAAMYFFKLFISPSGSVVKIIDETTDINQTDLVGKRGCAVNENGNCAISKETKAPKEAKAPVVRKVGVSKPDKGGPSEPKAIEQEVLNKLQTLSLTPETSGASKEQVPREYFESMKNKMLIINWMLEKMKTQDIVECIKRGSLSSADVQRAESVMQNAPPVGPAGSASEASEIAANMNPEEVKNIFKQITKDDIVKKLKSISNVQDRTAATVQLCERYGYTTLVSKKTGKVNIFDSNEETVSLDEAINNCSEFESRRLRDIVLNAKRKFKTQAPKPKPQEVKNIFKQITKDDIIQKLKGISNVQARTSAVVQLCERYGYTSVVSKKTGKINIFDSNEETVSLDEAINNCSEFESRRLRDLMLNAKRKFKTQRSPMESVMEQEVPLNKQVNLEQVISEINNLDIDSKVTRVSEICVSHGYTVKKSKAGKLIILDPDDDPATLEESISACMAMNAFGKCRKRVIKPRVKRVVKPQVKRVVKPRVKRFIGPVNYMRN